MLYFIEHTFDAIRWKPKSIFDHLHARFSPYNRRYSRSNSRSIRAKYLCNLWRNSRGSTDSTGPVYSVIESALISTWPDSAEVFWFDGVTGKFDTSCATSRSDTTRAAKDMTENYESVPTNGLKYGTLMSALPRNEDKKIQDTGQILFFKNLQTANVGVQSINKQLASNGFFTTT